jgi:hypothetical protein
MTNTDMEFMPYLQFQGNCEEALHFYKEIPDGRIEITSCYDHPVMYAPDDFKNKILHAGFYFRRPHEARRMAGGYAPGIRYCIGPSWIK